MIRAVRRAQCSVGSVGGLRGYVPVVLSPVSTWHNRAPRIGKSWSGGGWGSRERHARLIPVARSEARPRSAWQNRRRLTAKTRRRSLPLNCRRGRTRLGSAVESGHVAVGIVRIRAHDRSTRKQAQVRPRGGFHIPCLRQHLQRRG